MMNGHESYLVRIMIKVMIMVTIKINDEFRNTGVYIRRKDSLMSSIRTINSCSLFCYPTLGLDKNSRGFYLGFLTVIQTQDFRNFIILDTGTLYHNSLSQII